MLLYSKCKEKFADDAWLAVGKNMKHYHDERQLILPVYTEAEERFWLLYCMMKPIEVHEAGPLKKIKGYCKDLRPTQEYEVLHSEKVTLLGKKIIRTPHGAMYFVLNEALSQTRCHNLPPGNREAIKNALELLH